MKPSPLRIATLVIQVSVALVLALQPLLPLFPPQPRIASAMTPQWMIEEEGGKERLYRTRIEIPSEAHAQRLVELGVALLAGGEGDKWVLADEAQVETLARLRFHPRETDALDTLVAAHRTRQPWLAEQLDTLLGEQEIPLAARVSAEQGASILALTSLDDDGDGLTNTEEGWWCTRPDTQDSDSDLVSDGEEVRRLLAGNNTSGKPFLGWPDSLVNCFDDDTDSIPDLAEVNVIGLNNNRESTDGDKFDDGQEFFGITKYPAYGALPRPEDSFITANMPGWVDPPGNSPFVAAYPQIAISIVPDSVSVELVTELTTGETHGVGETLSYETSHTHGTSTGVGKEETHTYSTWQEVGNTLADAMERSTYQSRMQSHSQQYSWEHSLGVTNEVEYGLSTSVAVGTHANVSLGTQVDGSVGLELGVGATLSADVEVGISAENSVGESWSKRDATSSQTTYGGSRGYEVGYETGQSVSVSQIHERSQVHGVGRESAHATTFTREEYDEIAVTNGNALATSTEWSTATAVDTSHTADLTFRYRVVNQGSDNARRIDNILFHLSIGDEQLTAYAGNMLGSQCQGTVVQNLYPGSRWPATTDAVQCDVPLSLEALKQIDLGTPIRVVVADYSYGDDEQFYENAWGGGVILEVDDGTWDGDEEIDNYLIPTWGEETYQDVIRRYFRVTENAQGDIRSVFTPEYDPNHEISGWTEHAIGPRSWWNVYLSAYGEGRVVPFRSRRTMPETRLLMRFNQDTDGDRFSDRVEQSQGTDYQDSRQHPNASLTAAAYEVRQGDEVEVQLALQNFGNYDAYGIEAHLFSPDATTTVESGLVGIGGHLAVGEKVLLSSRIEEPDPLNWSGSAYPLMGGHYDPTLRQDQRITFTVEGTGTVGQTAGLRLAWTSNDGRSGTLAVGVGYTPPSALVVADGIKVGMASGTLVAGEQFAVSALSPRDVFRYTIHEELYTPPVIVVSYNDPEGNHRIVTPHRIAPITTSLAPYVGTMQPAPEVSLLSDTAFQPGTDNTLTIGVVNPLSETIAGSHLFVAFATLSGTLVAQQHLTPTLLSGPTLHSVVWNTEVFSPTYQPDTEYKIKVYATDHAFMPLDVAFEQVATLGQAAPPKLALSASALDLGTVVQGVERTLPLAFANVGQSDLWLWVGQGTPVPLHTPATIARVGVGEVATTTLRLDSAQLSLGAFQASLEVRTNDPLSSTLIIPVSGVVQAATNGVVAYSMSELRPWDEMVTVMGTRPPHTIVPYLSPLLPEARTEPLYLYSSAGEVIGSGMQAPLAAPPDDGLLSSPTPRGERRPPSEEASEDSALSPEVWLDATKEWRTQESASGFTFRYPPTSQVVEAYTREGGGYQYEVMGDHASIIVVTEPDEQAIRTSAYPGLAKLSEGHQVREVRIKGMPGWEIIPPSTAEWCMERIVAGHGEWLRFRLQARRSSDCSDTHLFDLVVSSSQYRLETLLGTPAADSHESDESDLEEPSHDSEGESDALPPAQAIAYNRQAAYDYQAIYALQQTNSDGHYYRSGGVGVDGAHYVAHVLEAGGFPIHWSAGQDHGDSRVYNVAAQRNHVLGSGHVSQTGAASLTTGDLIYVYGGSWCWEFAVVRSVGGVPYISAHSIEIWDKQYDWYHCGTNRTYEFVHINDLPPPPGTPTLHGIDNGDGDGNYGISWSGVGGATQYTLQEQFNGGGWTTIQQGGSTSGAVGGRGSGAWCYRVLASNEGGSSGWSNGQCTTVRPDQAPLLSSIANSDGDGAYTISWSSVNGATSYTLQEQRDSGAWATVYTGGATNQNRTGRGAGNWCYRVQATNAGGSTGWSNTRCTVVNSRPNAPTHLVPNHNAGWLSRPLTLSWQDGGDPDNWPNPSRQYRVAINAADTGWSALSPWLTSPTWQITVPSDGFYTWHVTASDGSLTQSSVQHSLHVYSLAKTAAAEVRIALPEATTQQGRYRVQHGVWANFASTTPSQVVTVTLPNRVYDFATLDLVISHTPTGSLSYRVDLGNDNEEVWEGQLSNGSNGVTLPSGNLAAALNHYLASRPDAPGALVAVPIALDISTSGRMYLTDGYFRFSPDIDPSIGENGLVAAPSTPQEGHQVLLSARVTNGGTFTATNVLATFFAGDPALGGILLGSDLISSLPPQGSRQATFEWNTTGYGGPLELFAVVDMTDQLHERREDNNVASTTVTVRTRPDLESDAITLATLARTGFANMVSVVVSNQGQTDVTSQQVGLYRGDPGQGGILLGEQAVAVAASLSATVAIPWTPTQLGPVTLYAVADHAGGIAETNEANNVISQTLYVGLGEPLRLDAGATGEVPYTPETGYGYLSSGTTSQSCGTHPYQSYRQQSSGSGLSYRFDHLLPGRFYHLDLSFFLCSGSREFRVLIDGNVVAQNVTANQVPNFISLRMDPSFYADHSITVTIEKSGGGLGGPVVSELFLTDVRYCYRDSGHPAEGGYSVSADGCGWLNGSSDQGWGTLPYQSVRYDDEEPVQYRFDDLLPSQNYQLDLTFYEGDGAGRVQTVQVDGVPLLTNVALNGTARLRRVNLPPELYADGSIVVAVLGATQPIVSEIAVEQNTRRVYDIASPTPTATPTTTASATRTPTASSTVTPTPSVTASATPSATGTPTATATASTTPSATATRTPTAIASATPSATGTPTATATGTPTSPGTLNISDVRITNVNNTAFTVSWLTDVVSSGMIRFGTDPTNLNRTAMDLRGAATSDDTHYVRVASGLTPNTTYYFDVVSGSVSDTNGGVHYQVRTGPALSLPASDQAYGSVTKADGTSRAAGTIVYLTLQDQNGVGSTGEAATLSALVDGNGFWSVNLGNARTADLTASFIYSPSGGDEILLEAQGAGDGAACSTIDTASDSPAAILVLAEGCLLTEEVPLEAGWNLLALPLHPATPYTAETICAEANAQGGSLSEVNRWNAGGWDGHICGLPFNDFPIELGAAIFLFAEMPSTWSVTGRAVVNPVPIMLEAGWTALGIPQSDQYTAESLCDDMAAQNLDVVEIDRWEAGGWDGHVCGLPFNDFPLVRGSGYFVLTETGGSYTPSYGGLSFTRPEHEPAQEAPSADRVGAPLPIREMRVSNLRDTSVTISWVTEGPTSGWMRFGIPQGEEVIAYDTRGAASQHTTHAVVLTNLTPATAYTLTLVSGTGEGKDAQLTHTITTTHSPPPLTPAHTLYGTAWREDGVTPAVGTLVYLFAGTGGDRIDRDSPGMLLSTLVDEHGYWHINLGNTPWLIRDDGGLVIGGEEMRLSLREGIMEGVSYMLSPHDLRVPKTLILPWTSEEK